MQSFTETFSIFSENFRRIVKISEGFRGKSLVVQCKGGRTYCHLYSFVFFVLSFDVGTVVVSCNVVKFTKYIAVFRLRDKNKASGKIYAFKRQ